VVPRLELQQVSFRYQGNLALADVSLSLPEGELHAIIGPNGAGKSTLFGVISGEHRPASGAVLLDGMNVTRLPPHARTRLGVVRAFQVARVFPNLTVRDNLRIAVIAAQRRDTVFWRRARCPEVEAAVEEILSRMRLTPLADRGSMALSQGDRKRLEIAMALGVGGSLLLLDEPTAGMSPEETDATVALLAELWRQGGLTILLTEHDMRVVFHLAQRVTVLVRGRVLCTGTVDEVRAREDVREAYLGRSGAHA
jgi:branched-chain amino acid transport system ATP-binding protein